MTALSRITLLVLCYISFSHPITAQENKASIVQELDKLYQINFEEGDYTAAEFNLLEGLEIRKKELGAEHPITLEAKWSLAVFYQKIGKTEDAEIVYERIIPSYLKVYGSDNPQVLGVLVNAAAVYNELGEYDQAIELYLLAKEATLKSTGKEHASYVYVLQGLATTCYNLNRNEEAASYYQEVLTIEEKIYGVQHPKYAFTLSNLAAVYQATNKLAEAIQLIKQALYIQRKQLGKEDDDYANSLNTLAVLYIKQEQYEEAEKTILEVLSIFEKKLGKEHPWYQSAQSNLASLWIRQGNYAQAEVLCLALNEQQRQAFGKKHPSYISNLGLTAKLYLNTGQLDKALDFVMQSIHACLLDGQKKVEYSEAFIEQIATLKYDYELKINYLYDLLITTLHDKYKKDQDPKWLKQRHKVIKNVIVLNETFRNAFSFEQDKFFILKEVASFINKGMESSQELQAMGIEGNHQEDAFIFAEQNKSILLLDALKSKRKRYLGNLPDSVVQQERALQKEQSALQKKLLDSPSASGRSAVRSELNDLKNEISQFKAVLQKTYPRYFNSKYSSHSILNSVKEIQAVLEEDALILEYFVADSMTYLFTLSKENVGMFPLNLTKTEIATQVKKFRKALSEYEFIINNKGEAWDLYTQMGRWLYEHLVAPGLQDVEGIKKLVIIPDYELGHLPFEAFLTGSTEQKTGYKNLDYVLKKYQVSYSYSAILLKENINNPILAPNHKVFACAAAYDTKLDKEGIRELRGEIWARVRNALKPLPATKKEVDGLASLFAGEFLTGGASTEQNFKKKAPNYGIIHLAMHGILSEEAPILSSMAFSEDLNPEEDNFLQAYEISQLELNAELVVLSACETGLGKFEQGEGVLSLARSFMYAGVPAMVVSLWQVHDLSTAILMQHFYKNLLDGMDKDEALRQAKIYYIEHAKGITAHPAFWSPFVQIGDHRALRITSKWGWLWWSIGVGVLGLGLVVLKRRKNIG